MHIPDIVQVDFYCRYVIKISLNDVNDETTHAGIQDAPCGNRDKTLAQTVIQVWEGVVKRFEDSEVGLLFSNPQIELCFIQQLDYSQPELQFAPKLDSGLFP